MGIYLGPAVENWGRLEMPSAGYLRRSFVHGELNHSCCRTPLGAALEMASFKFLFEIGKGTGRLLGQLDVAESA